MSYSIIYDKQFIKVGENQYIGNIIVGSSNCYDCSGRRSRDWSTQRYNGKLVASEEDILADINGIDEKLKEQNKRRDQDDIMYNGKNFEYFTAIKMYGRSSLTFKNYVGFHKTAMREALTIEQLTDYLSVAVEVCYYTASALEKQGKEVLGTIYPKSTSELLAAIEKFSEVYGKDSNIFRVVIDSSDYAFERLKKAFRSRARRNRKPVLTDTYYMLRTVRGGYFMRKTKYGYKYSFHSGKRFKTEKEAKRKMETMLTNDFTIEERKLFEPQEIYF